jgi:hypothetical protein
MLFYKKLNVENFDLIRDELEKATATSVCENPRFWDVSFIWFKDNAPLLYNFIEGRKKVPIRMCRFYLTPAYDFLAPHADGTSDNRSPIGLNIPISGYHNTTMDWYSCPDDNFNIGNLGFNKVTASKVIDTTKLVKLDTTVIDCPTFVRTDVVHGITNNNPTSRLILSLRFPYSTHFGQNFEDVMNLI